MIFETEAGPLNGLKLIGFAVWERRARGRNVKHYADQHLNICVPGGSTDEENAPSA